METVGVTIKILAIMVAINIVLIQLRFFMTWTYRAKKQKIPITLWGIYRIKQQGLPIEKIFLSYLHARHIDREVGMDDLVAQAKAGVRIRSVISAMEIAKDAGVELSFEEVCQMEREGDTNVIYAVKQLLKSKGCAMESGL